MLLREVNLNFPTDGPHLYITQRSKIQLWSIKLFVSLHLYAQNRTKTGM